MKVPVRYIITRPCLSEGSLRLLKYLEPTFSQDGPVELRDEQGRSYTARVERAAGRVWGLRDLYHDHHLGVNDVLVLQELEAGRFQVDCVVKPAPSRNTTTTQRLPDPPRRVVVNQSAYVREVRMERPGAAPVGGAPAPSTPEPETASPAPAATVTERAPLATPTAPSSTPAAPVVVARAPQVQVAARPSAAVSAPERPNVAPLETPEGQLRELAQLTGYQAERLAPGVLRLRANLGAHGYSVLLALAEEATQGPAWREPCDYQVLLTTEAERPQGVPRLTREALSALIEHARLTPLSPIELRGYWNTGSFDLESVSSLAELVSAQLQQRGTLSFVLMTLGQQPAHSVVSLPRLAERLGSGVNAAELRSILDGLCRPPLGLLTPLSSNQYYLRSDMDSALRELSEYAEGLRRRLTARASAAD